MEFSSRRAGLGAAALAACIAATPAWADDDEDCRAGGSLRLVNGKIHTMDKNDSIVSSVLIRNGKFAAVGHRRGDDGGDECARTINLHGRTVVPGIIDNHDHIILLGLRPGHDTRIENARSIPEVLSTLAARAREVPAGDWITSLGGFNINQFTPPPAAPRFPTLAELDTVTPNHPALILQSFTGPSVTNSKGRAFFTANHVTVADDGSIASGAQSVRALNKLRAMQTIDEQKRGLGYAMTYSAEVGVTTHLDQGGFPNTFTGRKEDDNDVDALANFDRYRAFDSVQALYQERRLTNRIFINFLHLEDALDTPELHARLLNVFPNFGDNMLKIHGIGEFTANGYAVGAQQWKNGTRLVAQARWSNENHSLSAGDFKVIIDEWVKVQAEELAAGRLGIADLRWVVAHVPFITQEYIDKLKALGGGLSAVGGWRYISGSATGNGPPFRRIIDSGIKVGMSCDGMQISPLNPWLGMYYAVTGKNARGVLINGGQQITRKEVLKLYTADNGWFLREEDNIGTIEEGKWADLIVLSADYFDESKVSDEQIKDIYSVLTIVNGKIVHDNLDGRKRMYWNRDSRRAIGL
jgi:predicted amidohydrolase YtcJ